MKISVIIPCYNAKSTIEKSIYSVIEQSYKDIEIIVVDDRSTDDTRNIVKNIINDNDNVKLFSTIENTGSPAEPRNIGITHSKGDYVCFLDSDDYWYIDKVERQLDFMLRNDAAFTYSAYDVSNSMGEVSTYIPREKVNYVGLLNLNVIGCLSTMIKRDAIGDTRFLNESLEDYSFWLAILKKGYTAYSVSSVPLCCYNLIENSRSSDKISLISGYYSVFLRSSNGNVFKAYFLLVRYIINYLKKYN